MAMTNNVTFKVVLEAKARSGGEAHIRRISLSPSETVLLDQLRMQTKQLFSLEDSSVWYFKWKDEEGDLVTITEEYELQDAVNTTFANNNNTSLVVRLVLVVEKPQQAFSPMVFGFDPRTQHHHHHHSLPPWCGWFHQQQQGNNTNPPEETQQQSLRALCDHTGTRLSIEQQNWFHQPASSVDLCKEEIDRLGEQVRSKFVFVTKPEDLGQDLERYQGRARTCHRGRGFGGGRCGRGGRCGAQPNNTASPSTPSPVDESNPPAPAYTATVVSGPSIAFGTQVKAGARLIPVWEVLNSATEQAQPWTDVRVKPVKNTPNPLQAPEEGFEVPMLAPGERGIVSVELVVPKGLSGKTPATFELVDANGNSFGTPLEIVVDVLPDEEDVSARKQPTSALPPVHNEVELLQVLHAMGFGDEAACVEAIRQCKGNVNNAALKLLSASPLQ